ncbi:MAG TPA: hypothetical protein VMI31_01450 [Fimbriimonadaceae bacterium]|nr:hypothetical protein [Fimbriimonadaceae bacterium]
MRIRVFLVVVLAVGACFAAHAQEAEGHRAVLEIGGALAVETPGGSTQTGGTLAVEKTFVERWLELELGISAFGGPEPELSVDLLFKKPYPLGPKSELMIGLGPEVVRSMSGPDRGTFFGVGAALDLMFWPSPDVGWYLEPGYEVVFRGRPERAVNVTGGLLIGW